jgi:subtilisin family serine protease
MRTLGAAGALLAAAVLAPAFYPAHAASMKLHVGSGVREELATGGRVRVLVARPETGAVTSALPTGFEVVRSLSNGRILSGWLSSAGLAGLESDGTSGAVVLDRIVRPAGQIGTAQIGADRLLAAGVTGAGRTIAIVDTGIDLFHPDFGASASGGGRIAGGWNFADGNADVYDCDGHGTSVAGVAAGAQGIAPEASIVALKVFGARDGCLGALASDVLAAVDWALERREELGIEVLNLSLADDRVRNGFCDSEDPVSARLFARARAEGLAVVAASGNSGQIASLSWPACHSDVVSVGMVYSAGQGPNSWDGAEECSDPVTGPDVVPCISNGGPGLSILAPGVRWIAPTTGGGRHTTFSGTSAAAPAAAASLLLSRQVEPSSDPVLSADFLRLTGVPVTSNRTGTTTPRVDVGTAYTSASPFTGPCEPVAASGTTRGAIVCRTSITALVGRVSSLSVALSLERPRLAGLTALLTGPDGTTVRLLDGPALAGTVFREVIGRTVESDEPLSLFAGRPAAGTWSLRLEDGDDPAESRLTSWALVIEPESPQPTTPSEPATRLLPTITRNAGLLGSFFTTDLVLFNPDDQASADVTLSFLPSGRPHDTAATVNLSLPPLSTRVLDDVVGNAFRTTGFGPVHVSAPQDVVVASRTETTRAGGGSYGLLVPDVGPEAAIGVLDPPAWLAPVSRPGSSRVNAGFVEISGAPASVELLVRDRRGSVKGRLAVDLEAFESRQINDVHRSAAVTATAEDLFEVRVLSGSGRAVAWATAIDNGSNDGLLDMASQLRRDAYLPAAARSPGRFGSHFRTDLKLANPWPSPVNVRVSYSPSKGDGPFQLILSLGAWETRLFEDALSSLFGLPDGSAGALRLTVLGNAPGIVASSRTCTEDSSRSSGFAVSVLEDAEAVSGERIALTFLSSSVGTRTNLGFLETLGVVTRVRVTLLDVAGLPLAARELLLDRNQAVQWNDVFAEMDAAPRENASALVEVLDGGAVIAHAIRVDNRTNDASFLPGKVLRPTRPRLLAAR